MVRYSSVAWRSGIDPNQHRDRQTIELDRSLYRNGERRARAGQRQHGLHRCVASLRLGQARAHELRRLDGTGKLKTSAGNLLPFNVNGFPNLTG